MLRITDKEFHYTPSFNTDLKKRFAKMIREQRAAAEAAAKVRAPAGIEFRPAYRRPAQRLIPPAPTGKNRA